MCLMLYKNITRYGVIYKGCPHEGWSPFMRTKQDKGVRELHVCECQQKFLYKDVEFGYKLTTCNSAMSRQQKAAPTAMQPVSQYHVTIIKHRHLGRCTIGLL